MNSEEFRETFLRMTEKGPQRSRWRERKKPSRRRAQAVTKKRIEKKQKVPQGRRASRKMLGEDQPKTCRKEQHTRT